MVSVVQRHPVVQADAAAEGEGRLTFDGDRGLRTGDVFMNIHRESSSNESILVGLHEKGGFPRHRGDRELDGPFAVPDRAHRRQQDRESGDRSQQGQSLHRNRELRVNIIPFGRHMKYPTRDAVYDIPSDDSFSIVILLF